MKVILTQAIPNLGAAGALVTVKPGYGRNYLLPRQLAVAATEKNIRQYKQLFDEFQTKVQGYCNRFGLNCTRTSTEIKFDELILRMMRQVGAVK